MSPSQEEANASSKNEVNLCKVVSESGWASAASTFINTKRGSYNRGNAHIDLQLATEKLEELGQKQQGNWMLKVLLIRCLRTLLLLRGMDSLWSHWHNKNIQTSHSETVPACLQCSRQSEGGSINQTTTVLALVEKNYTKPDCETFNQGDYNRAVELQYDLKLCNITQVTCIFLSSLHFRLFRRGFFTSLHHRKPKSTWMGLDSYSWY